ncbi:hypothetical protein LCGC14_3116050 [marine sediment metagenome]|uniref:Uncharacterized protein n=1 Tax=marine sediment metagenome TaxID=412755 RepID=A0A0F8W403_9ZZZZ
MKPEICEWCGKTEDFCLCLNFLKPKNQTCAECGHDKSNHKIEETNPKGHCTHFNGRDWDCECEKFKPKSKLSKEQVSKIARKTLVETGFIKPKNHSPQGRKVGSATVSPAELKDEEPEDLVSNVDQFDSDTSGSDNHGSDDNCERIAKIIDPDNTFLDECEKVVQKRFGSDDEFPGVNPSKLPEEESLSDKKGCEKKLPFFNCIRSNICGEDFLCEKCKELKNE